VTVEVVEAEDYGIGVDRYVVLTRFGRGVRIRGNGGKGWEWGRGERNGIGTLI